MSQDGPENQSHGNAHPASRQNRKTNHVGIALAAISAVVTCAWVLPSVFDYWGHWWMKAIVCAFGITTAYLLYAILRQWARWSHELAFFAASILAIFYFTVLTVAWVGGDMARIFSERRVRLGLAVFLTIGAISAWLQWYFMYPESSRAPSSSPTSKPAVSTMPTVQLEIPSKTALPVQSTQATIPQLLEYSGSRTGPKALPDGRIVVEVNPQEVCGHFENHMQIHAERLVEHYIGKWTKVSGHVEDVRDNTSLIFVRLSEYSSTKAGFFISFEPQWRDRLRLLRRGDEISILGQITKIERHRIDLDYCALV